MASFDSSSGPTLSLLALPGEIQNAIIAGLDFRGLYTLRLTNRYFYSLIPPMPSEKLLQIEKESMPYRFFACMECKRLRPITKFIPGTLGLLKRLVMPSRFVQRCRECVRLKFKEPGSRWMEYNVPIVRCVECKKAGQAPVDTRVLLHGWCYAQRTRKATSSSSSLIGSIKVLFIVSPGRFEERQIDPETKEDTEDMKKQEDKSQR